MARLERESLGRPSKDGQTIGGCNVFLTESIGRSALVESITHRMDVEKPPILETACGAQS
ncbi:hypothetical protein HYT84_04010, partial [Candidatus Micrarchaeota archaeon]|nr:hypothetical protein [Candidatus Micrarchaeota archaeon]